VVTNIDHEHVDFYPELADLRSAFAAFLERVPFYGAAVLCADDPEVRALAPTIERKVLTYGLDPAADVRAERIETTAPTRQVCSVLVRGRQVGELELPFAGRHNLRNALAAVGVGLELGLAMPEIAGALHGFTGVGRRCEDHGEHGGVRLLDDYGHHPTEVQATLQVARGYGRRLVVLFQPHRFTRTARFWREFGDVLAAADLVALLPVYPAGEPELAGVGSDLIAEALRSRGADVDLLGSAADIRPWLDRRLRSGDLLLTLGAGDIGRRVEEIRGHLDAKEVS
jgi:UDP-N-acetylmuramate--alanine ligase